MLIRYVRKGIDTGNDTGNSGSVQVNGLQTFYYAAVSSSLSTSFAQAGFVVAGTASISVSAFIPPTFVSLTILDSNFAVIETLSGSFVSGNIFGGDKFHWSESVSSFLMGDPISSSLVPISGALAYPQLNITTIVSGAASGAAAVIPTEGQVFPRGVCS